MSSILLVSGYAAIGVILWPTSANQAQDRPKINGAAIATFLGSFSVYLFLLAPTAAPFLGSELSAASATLGITHAPGYPLFVLIGKVCVSLIPFGNAAYRINLGTAALMALSNTIFLTIIHRLFNDILLAVTGAVIFATARILMLSALTADTVTLDIFLLLLLIRASLEPNVSLPLLGFLFGLGLGSHQTIGLVGPAGAYLIISRRRPGWHEISTTLLLLLLSLSVYLFLPIRARQGPVIDGGKPDTVSDFVRFVTRKDYGALQLAPESVSAPNRPIMQRLKVAGEYLATSVSRNYSWWGLVCGLVGCAWLLLTHPTCGIFFLLFFGVPFLVIGTLSGLPSLDIGSFDRAIFDRIAAIWYPALCLWITLGGFALSQAAASLLSISEFKTKILALVLSLPCIVSAMAPIPSTYNYRDLFYAYDYTKNILRSIPPNGFLFFPGDIAYFASLYFQNVEGMRPDAKFLHQSTLAASWARPALSRKWPESAPINWKQGLPSYTEAFAQNASRRQPVMIETNSGNLSAINTTQLSLEPLGMFQMVNGRILPLAIRKAPLDLMSLRDTNPGAREDTPVIGEIFTYYAAAYVMWGNYYAAKQQWQDALSFYHKALPLSSDYQIPYKIAWVNLLQKNLESAEDWLERTIATNPAFAPAYHDLAGIYLATNRRPEAIQFMEMATRLAPSNQDYLNKLHQLRTVP